MLDKRFVRSFFNWLEAAPLPELLAKRTELEAALEGFREPEARRDALPAQAPKPRNPRTAAIRSFE
ncbi:MAG: hypothetical protein IPI02_22965 [Sterolibacteriaceae bacterium]|nr:hypothetical protein [Sterolibacteriaceae bacterium]